MVRVALEELARLGLDHATVVLLALIPGVLNLGILVYLALRARKNSLTYTFMVFVGATAVWQMSDAFVRMSQTLETARLWMSLLSAGALLIASAGVHFSLFFTGRTTLARSPWVLAGLYGPALVFEALARAGLGGNPLQEDATWAYMPVLPLTAVENALGLWVAILSMLILLLLSEFALRPATDFNRRRQATLVAAGFAVPTVQGILTQIVFPAILEIPPVPIASSAMTVFTLCTAVALRRYRFLEAPSLEQRLYATQAELQRKEELLAESQRIAHIGSWRWNVATGDVLWSDEMYQIYDYPLGTPITFERAMERVVADDASRIREQLEAAFSEAHRAFTSEGRLEFALAAVEYRIRLPSQEVRALHGDGRLFLALAGHPREIIGTVQDVTEIRAAEVSQRVAAERLHEIQRLEGISTFKTQLLNTASHELNTPLTPLKLQLHLLKGSALGRLTKPQRNAVDILDRNVDRITLLVHNMLDVGRIQSGRLQLKKARMELGQVVRESAESFQELARRADLQLKMKLDAAVWIDADKLRLTQVLYNLLSNAIKYTPPGGRIHVTMRLDGESVQVRVEDTGIGLAPDQVARLFQPFGQVHDVQGPDYRPGSGLGLYISKGLMEQHGGRLWVESEGVNRGSTFVLSLPMAEPPAIAPTASPVGVAPPARRVAGPRPRWPGPTPASTRSGGRPRPRR